MFIKAVPNALVFKKFTYKKQYFIDIFVNIIFTTSIFVFSLINVHELIVFIVFSIQMVLSTIYVLILDEFGRRKRAKVLTERIKKIMTSDFTIDVGEIRRLLIIEFNEVYFRREIEKAIKKFNKKGVFQFQSKNYQK